MSCTSGAAPTRPTSPPGSASPTARGSASAFLWRRETALVRALLQERQERRKAELDASRRDAQFQVGA